jgi:hypothetical protein
MNLIAYVLVIIIIPYLQLSHTERRGEVGTNTASYSTDRGSYLVS